MKAIKIIFFLLISLVIVVLALSFATSTTLKSERSIVINAPKSAIFEQVRLLANNQKWSPWAEKDPQMKTNIAGTDGTVGAIYSWEGNDDVGKGEQTIAKIENDKRVDINLHFIKPFESNAVSHITLDDDPNGVKVTWGFDGKMARPWNVLGLFMNMEKSIGEDFSKGLAKLKTLVESAPAVSGPANASYDIQESTLGAQMYLGIRKEVGFDKISQMFSENMPKLYNDAKKAGLKMTGPPVGMYYKWDTKAMKTDMVVAIPVAEAKAKVGAWKTFEVKAGKVLVIDYHGAYDKLESAHQAMDKYIAEKKYTMLSPVIESYVAGPESQPDTSKWLTKIVYYVQ